jgi:hypothetical protein
MIHYNPTVSGSLVVTGSLITTGNINGINLSTFSASINNALTESKVTHIVSASAGVFYIDGTQKPSMSFVPGITYRFDTAVTDGHHPFKFSTTPNGPIQYVDGVTSGSNFIQLEVNYNTPDVLYYYCMIHNGMGNTINVLKIDKLLTTVSSSFDSRYVISGSITQTTWDNIASKPSGIVSGSSQVVDILSSINAYTGSNDTKWSTLQTLTASNSASISQINLVTASLNAATSSYETKGSGIVSGSSQITYASISSIPSGIVSGSIQVLGGTNVVSGSSQIDVMSTTNIARLATTGSNTFFGTQTYSGSVYIANDLIVQGSSSIQYISASSVSIGTNIVQLNTANPSVRFAGLTIIDSGSVGGSGSFLYDSVHDEFIFVHRGNGVNVTSSHFILGPETIDNLGNETYLTNNRIPKGTGIEHLNDSNITDTGTLITLGSNTIVNGTLLASGTSLVSSSAQVVEILSSLNTYTSSLKTALQLTGSNVVVTGDLTVLGTTNTANSTTLNISDKFITLASGSTSSAIANGAGFRIAGANVTMSWDSTNSQLKFNTDISASKFYGDGTGLIFNGSGIVSSSVQTIANLPTGTVSGSSQVVSILSSLNTYTGSNDTTNTAQSARLTTIESVTGSYETKGSGIVSGSSQITYTGISSIPSGIVSGSSQTIANLPTDTVSGSSQINVMSTTNIARLATTGSNTFIGNQTITGSLLVSGSAATFRNVISTSNSNIQVGNDTSSNGGGIALFGSGFTPSNQYRANGAYFYSNLAGGLTLHAEGINSMYLATNNTTAATISSAQVVNFANLPTVASSNMRTDANTSYSTTFTSVSSVSVTHSLGTKNVMVMCYDSADEMFWPATIKTTSTSVVDITFTVARTGRVVIIR